jgi:group II intron reverse transcriptase/maturase
MQDAQTYLEIVRNRGQRRCELKRVYRNLRNQELFLRAYAKLYANDGALTPGTNPEDIADGMSLKRIAQIINQLETGTYEWQPHRRTYRDKKNGGKRPLGVPGWNDKLVQEVIRIILNAYYEPQFSKHSHGFRPGHGCHTALQNILAAWKGTKWFIKGDIQGCFDNIDHTILLNIIGRNIKDERFIKLLKGMFNAGYLENWKHHQTYSGVPQGGIVSPILANIFLNELDTFIEQELLPQYTKGKQRQRNTEYSSLTYAMQKAAQEGNVQRYKQLDKQRRTIPCGDPNDPNYRRLKYVRYCDDYLLGFAGPKSEAKEIQTEIGSFLQTIGLNTSADKNLITHATTHSVRFLGYDVYMAQANHYRYGKRRTLNGVPLLSVPREVTHNWCKQYMRKGKPAKRPELLNRSDYDIVTTYNMEFQGLANYYVLAYNISQRLQPVRWICSQSLARTLAGKHRKKLSWVFRHYLKKQEEGHKYITVEVQREDRKPLTARFGTKPIRYDRWATIDDTIPPLLMSRNELVERLLANQCELCGSKEDIEVHHIRKLKNLKQRYQGRPNPPQWVVKMISIRRKTLVVCKVCHRNIHNGVYDGPKLN